MTYSASYLGKEYIIERNIERNIEKLKERHVLITVSHNYAHCGKEY